MSVVFVGGNAEGANTSPLCINDAGQFVVCPSGPPGTTPTTLRHPPSTVRRPPVVFPLPITTVPPATTVPTKRDPATTDPATTVPTTLVPPTTAAPRLGSASHQAGSPPGGGVRQLHASGIRPVPVAAAAALVLLVAEVAVLGALFRRRRGTGADVAGPGV